MMRAIGYVRRSKESESNTISLEVQRERITAYAGSHGWQLADVVTDDGLSGGRRDRLVRLRDRVKVLQAEVIVVYSIDRLARDVAALLDCLRALARAGVQVHDISQGLLDVRSSNGLLTTGMHGLVAEHFRITVSEKTRDALHRLRELGYQASGQLPYGYRAGEWMLNGDGKAHRPLTPNDAEQAVLALIATLHGNGLSLRRISRELVTRGILARNGRPFAPATLARLVTHRAMRDNGSAGRADTSAG